MEETPSKDNLLLRRPAVTTVVLLSALLVPVVALPYALTRRRISRLTRQIDHLVATNADLQVVVSKSAHDIALRQEELARATSLLERSKNEISLLRRDISQTQAQLNSFHSATRAELRALLEEGKLARHHLDLFPLLGLSLADVAAFMHEVELHQGVPSSTIHDHGIERLRTLALKLQISPTPHKVGYSTKFLEQTLLKGSRDIFRAPGTGSAYFAAANVCGLPRTLHLVEANIAAVL